MYKVTFDNKDKTDKAIYIKHSYSVKGTKKAMIVEKYSSANELNEKYGDWEKFIDERIKILEKERKDKINEKKDLTIDYSMPINNDGMQTPFLGFNTRKFGIK